ncbi:hypothetical protein BD309DRAFT_320643 [Dichomitus squalens]|uniref:Uncharacterized protein n=2 Tax=Dichomitus squalens TaxID=114155 RepID=A0A4Q9NJM5_9APHY|nr:uncharacterized protein DICSQDRAFT_140256 [Dichomitus squalens LYAD-421 SS1]EJF57578.1 hypothetical protein DICSQDRAFT_140256 [Dichomitus squalens LYAD-421 SS1]TBU40775.1 hypothetical protein BD309DRAFT_320643 [Dichomitus squalens]TBU59607.1 hypothetical protein BD310DRAFT_384789 [Dichomitus squalens]
MFVSRSGASKCNVSTLQTQWSPSLTSSEMSFKTITEVRYGRCPVRGPPTTSSNSWITQPADDASSPAETNHSADL